MMVWVVEKKVFYHILDMGFESVGIPIRVKFEFEVKDGSFVPDSQSIDTLYNEQAVVNRYPNLKKDVLKRGIDETIKRDIHNYLKTSGYIRETNDLSRLK
jgi:hypothetical protein